MATLKTENAQELPLYHKKGQMVGPVAIMVGLIVGVGVAALVIIFVGALGGQTYNLVQADIDAINDTTIKGHVEAAIVSGFSALDTSGSYLPLIVLATVIGIVLTIVLGLGALGGSGGGRTAL